MRERLQRELSDRYLIDRELGRGGMATVWLAHDRRHDRQVALKVLHPDLASSIGVDRFIREVRLTARLQHPGVVPVLDSGVLPAAGDVALPWYAMTYVAGESLRQRLDREGQLPIDDALRITHETSVALEAAHEQGIVHRDIKPENIILADGRVYVLDFGIAKALIDTGDERLTSTGLALGTPAYMSPEQATAGVVDARTDQYALAAVLYEMLAGEPPFSGPNAQAVIARRLTETARPIRSVRPAVPQALEDAVLKALERVPADRFPSVPAFAAALQGAGTSTTTPRSRVSPAWQRVGAAIILLAVAAVALWTTSSRRDSLLPAHNSEFAALYRRGVRSYEQRTTAGAIDAIQSFRALLARDSTYAPGWAGLAKTYVRVVERQFPVPGMSQDSILRLSVAALDRALALDTTDADVWAGQAAVSRKVDPTDVRASIRAARKAIALDSLNGQAWHFLALGLAEQGEMDAALDAWRQGVKRSPRYTLGLAFLGQGLYWHKAFDSAAVWVDSALAVDPNYLTARMLLGQIEVERGNFARATAAFDAARRLSTDVEAANALAGRALAQARAGDRGTARASLREIDSLASMMSPPSLHTAAWIAESYAAIGDANSALRWLTRFPVPQDLHFQIHLRCDPPFAALANDRRFRSLLLTPAGGGGC